MLWIGIIVDICAVKDLVPLLCKFNDKGSHVVCNAIDGFLYRLDRVWSSQCNDKLSQYVLVWFDDSITTQTIRF